MNLSKWAQNVEDIHVTFSNTRENTAEEPGLEEGPVMHVSPMSCEIL